MLMIRTYVYINTYQIHNPKEKGKLSKGNLSKTWALL